MCEIGIFKIITFSSILLSSATHRFSLSSTSLSFPLAQAPPNGQSNPSMPVSHLSPPRSPRIRCPARLPISPSFSLPLSPIIIPNLLSG